MAIDAALAWSMVVTLVMLVFAAGGAWVRLGLVKRLDEDLRKHMKEESDWRMAHVQHGGHHAE
jgi:hypothetical protein